MTFPPRPIEPQGIFDGLRWSAILRGAVLDNVLTLLVVGALIVYLAGVEAFSGSDEAASRAVEDVLVSPEYLLFSLILGIAITAYAAFWAAQRAGALHLRHGGWTAVMSAALGSLFMLMPGANGGAQPPLWHDALGLALMLPAGILGGWIASRAARKGAPGG